MPLPSLVQYFVALQFRKKHALQAPARTVNFCNMLGSRVMTAIFSDMLILSPAGRRAVDCSARMCAWTLRLALVGACIFLSAAVLAAQTPADEQHTAAYFESVRDSTPLAYMFLREMPKGGDLHNHLSGTVYAETYIAWAAEEGLCVDSAGTIARPPCDAAAGAVPASAALTDAALWNRIIDAMSVRNWPLGTGVAAHDDFFAAFNAFRAVSGSGRTGEMLAELAANAAANNVAYVETMLTPDGGGAAALGRAAGFDPDFERARARLLGLGLRDTLAQATRALRAAFDRQREVLGCAGPSPQPGCGTVVRVQYQVARARPPELVFAQILAGFEMAAADTLVVSLNLVQPEDHPIALRDYALHMRMIAHLKRHYPGVPVTLHAGELTMGLVAPEELRFHIRQAVRVAGAARIGHGVDIAFEDSVAELLREMAQRRVLVEVALSSNDLILGVRGRDHPLRTYLRHGVPVALVTDDEGVARSDMTWEWLKAAQEHRLSYAELKQMARNSIQHAFVDDALKRKLRAQLEAGFVAFERGMSR